MNFEKLWSVACWKISRDAEHHGRKCGNELGHRRLIEIYCGTITKLKLRKSERVIIIQKPVN
jgi:hypothetical protein